MDDDIVDQLAEKITRSLLQDPKYPLDRKDPLISSGLLDSFNLVDLALYVEEEFGVRIEDYELNTDSFDTLEQLAELILQKKQ